MMSQPTWLGRPPHPLVELRLLPHQRHAVMNLLRDRCGGTAYQPSPLDGTAKNSQGPV
jgi:hypothetical protein